VFLTDADDQFDFSEIGKLLHFIPAYDGVIGYRFNRRDPIIRILLAKAWNWLNGLLFGLKFRDINCAFKLFKKSTVQNIGIKSKGAFISAELLIRLVRNGYKVKEVPVKHFPRREGVATGAKFRVIVKAFYEIFILFPELAAITHRQLVKYSIIGIINTFLDWGVYLGLTRIFAYFIQHYLFAKGISFCVAVTNSYFWNRYWTFRSKRKEILRQYVKFFLSQGILLVINVGIMYLAVSILHLRDLIGLVLTSLVSMAFGFLISKFWVFKEKN
jgi:putative flippase GtrA